MLSTTDYAHNLLHSGPSDGSALVHFPSPRRRLWLANVSVLFVVSTNPVNVPLLCSLEALCDEMCC